MEGRKPHGEETQEGQENRSEKVTPDELEVVIRRSAFPRRARSTNPSLESGGAAGKLIGSPSLFMKAPRRPVPSISPHFSVYRLKIRRSAIHRLGVFAAERIPRGRKVIEYTGRRVSKRALLKRARRMSRAARAKLIYLARVNRYWLLDGALEGSGAEFINHSCEPNLRPQRTRGHILLLSRRTIRKGEELSWDYRFSKKTDPVSCHCGSAKCRGTINLR
jgi:hypothetical protein